WPPPAIRGQHAGALRPDRTHSKAATTGVSQLGHASGRRRVAARPGMEHAALERRPSLFGLEAARRHSGVRGGPALAGDQRRSRSFGHRRILIPSALAHAGTGGARPKRSGSTARCLCRALGRSIPALKAAQSPARRISSPASVRTTTSPFSKALVFFVRDVATDTLHEVW